MTRSIAVLALALGCTTPPAAFAQLAKPDGNWYGSFGLGAAFTEGRTDSTNFNVTAEAARATEQDKYTLVGRFLRTSSQIADQQQTVARQGIVSARRDQNINENVFAFVMTELAQNQSIDLRLRQTYGVGLGRHFVQQSDQLFDVFAGVGYSANRYYAGDSSYVAELQVGEEFNAKLGQATTFKQRIVWYPSLQNGADYRWTIDASLVTALVGSWNLQLTYSRRYSTIVPAGGVRQEGAFLVSLTRSFGPR